MKLTTNRSNSPRLGRIIHPPVDCVRRGSADAASAPANAGIGFFKHGLGLSALADRPASGALNGHWFTEEGISDATD